MGLDRRAVAARQIDAALRQHQRRRLEHIVLALDEHDRGVCEAERDTVGRALEIGEDARRREGGLRRDVERHAAGAGGGQRRLAVPTGIGDPGACRMKQETIVAQIDDRRRAGDRRPARQHHQHGAHQPRSDRDRRLAG